MDTHPEPVKVLLVEDDLTTAHFFQAVLQPLPAAVDWARSCAQARGYVQSQAHHLWLIDLNLPDGNGMELLSQLRALHPSTPALAHTAELNSGARLTVQHASFIETLIKPFSAATLLRTVQCALQHPAGTPWDESAALKALGGQVQHLQTLRKLFLDELPVMQAAIHQALAQDDQATLNAYLHRLKASCGFVGAVQLARAVRQLQHLPNSAISRQ